MKKSINLLNPLTMKKNNGSTERPTKPLAVVCMLLVVITIAAFGIMFMLQRYTQSQLGAVRQEVNNMVKSEKASQVQGNVLYEWNQKSTQIDKLNTGRPVFSKYLDELRALTPPGVVLTNVIISENPFSATLNGIAVSPSQLAQFGRNLQESIYFKNCLVAESQKRPRDNAHDFTVTVVAPVEKGGNQ